MQRANLKIAKSFFKQNLAQKMFDDLILNRFLKDIIIPLQNRDYSTIRLNISNNKIPEDQKMLLNNSYINLPSSKLAYGLIISLNELLLQFDKNSILIEKNNEYLVKINSTKNIIQEFVYLEADISIKYLLYIEKYGIPLDGIFDEDKLNTIILEDYSEIMN
jgi:hypothetical protein